MYATKNKKTGRFQYRFRDSSGKQQQFSAQKHFPAGTTQRQADKIARSIHQAHEEAITGVIRPYLSDCVERMLEHLENNGVKGIDNYRSHAKGALMWDNDNSIDDITQVCIQMRDDMLKMKKPNGKLMYSNNTIGKRMYIYKRTANLAYQEWSILDLPLAGKMKPPAKPKARTRFLSVEDCFKLINACEDDQTRYILGFYALTGIRHAELTRLSSDDIRSNRITIDGKNGSTRSFAISQSAIDLGNKIILPLTRTYKQLHSAFIGARDIAGIEDFNMHDLRHTFASWLAQSGDVSLHQLQQVMGHKQINQTLNYAHLMPENLDNVAVNLTISSNSSVVH